MIEDLFRLVGRIFLIMFLAVIILICFLVFSPKKIETREKITPTIKVIDKDTIYIYEK